MAYIISKGDTLGALASKFGTTVQELLKLNPGIKNPNLIIAGASLNTPKTLESPADIKKNLDAPPGRTLPEETSKSRILQFADTINQATNLARNKRQALVLDELGKRVPTGALPASSFGDVLSDFEAASSRSSEPLLKQATDIIENEGKGNEDLANDLQSLQIKLAEAGAPESLLTKIPQYGTYSEALLAAAPYLKKTDKVDEEDLKKARLTTPSTFLGEVSGGDGYVNPQAYQDAYKLYIRKNPGKGKEFLDEFPVEIWINPKERHLFTKGGI